MNNNNKRSEDDIQSYYRLFKDSSDAIQKRIQARLQAKIEADQKRQTKIKYLQLTGLAASVFLAIGLLWSFHSENNADTITNNPTALIDIQPATDQAYLTLADGRQILLKTEENTLITTEGSQLQYENGEVIELPSTRSQEQVRITTPKGRQFSLVLPDGSRVWLNAESTLSYPLQFVENQRKVSLEGEAYFEVTHLNNQREFVVSTAQQEIKVWGTEFNINAYADQNFTHTTLIEGAVEVRTAGQSPFMLKPNQQAFTSVNGLTKVKQVESNLYSSWKTGIFQFDETELRQVMHQLSSWYDIEVFYTANIPPTYFYGEIDRQSSLNSLLVLLNKSGLQFKLIKNGSQNELHITN